MRPTDWVATVESCATQKVRADIAGDLLLPTALHDRLQRHGFHAFDAGDRFDEEGLVVGAAPGTARSSLAEKGGHPTLIST